MVVHEGLDYVIACGLRHREAYDPVSTYKQNVFRSALQNAGKRCDLSATLLRLQTRPRFPCLTQNSVGPIGLRWRFPTTMLSFSWINLPNISISGLRPITPRSENIVQTLVATFTLLALLTVTFVLFPLYPSRPIKSESFRLPS